MFEVFDEKIGKAASWLFDGEEAEQAFYHIMLLLAGTMIAGWTVMAIWSIS